MEMPQQLGENQFISHLCPRDSHLLRGWRATSASGRASAHLGEAALPAAHLAEALAAHPTHPAHPAHPLAALAAAELAEQGAEVRGSAAAGGVFSCQYTGQMFSLGSAHPAGWGPPWRER
jgi:hypothetical protein